VPANRAFTRSSRRSTTALASLLLIAGVLSCGRRDAGRVPLAASPVAGAGSARATIGLDRVVGRWLRADGGYVLEIRSVSPEGAVDASYMNPRPIRVARAVASRGGDLVTLVVELRDLNYPGSTYRLWYDAGRDTLEGTYYQAVQQETYDVAFVRQP
jgi:hypothetical protein